jgi:hypothetical protein
MSAPNNESKGPVILFFLTLWALSELIQNYDTVLIALALMVVGALTVRLIQQAIYRLGGKAWWLLLQLLICCAVFLYLAPVVPWKKLFILWSCGVPLLLAGGIARAVYERFASVRRHLRFVPPVVIVLTLVAVPAFSWNEGFGFWQGVLAALILCGLSGIPLYYGWRFAEPLPRPHDAGFGSSEYYRAAGMSDER